MELGRDVFVALAAVAWADGEVAPEEAQALAQAARACGLSGADLEAVEESTRQRVEFDALAGLELDDDAKSFVYAIASWIARADGVIHDAEVEILAKLGDSLKLSADERNAAQVARTLAATGTPDLKNLALAIADCVEEPPPGTARTGEPLPPPPGSRGWPLIGETLAFVRDPFRFVKVRLEKHGRLFKTRIVGRDVAVITGPAACELWVDQTQLMRDGSMFDHIFGLFGGHSLPSMDGAPHRLRKAQVLAGFDRAALSSYMPGLQAAIERRLTGWAAEDEIRWVPELTQLAIEGIAGNMLGLGPGPELDQLAQDYGAVTRGVGAAPIDLPGTPLRKANQARDRLLVFLREQVAACRKGRDVGFTRILQAKAADGSQIDDDAAVLELHHIFLAGYIVFAELAALVLRLDQNPELRQTLANEVREQAGAGEVNLETLHGMPLLSRVVDETKRITPMLPFIMAKAKRDISFAGHTIPAGFMVCLALHENHMLADIYPEPTRFDPERFAKGRAEHERHTHAFAPQGPGPLTGHKCPGTDYATYFMKMFTVLLLRGYSWELPKQELSYRMQIIPPEPKDGLRARVSALS